MDTLLQSVLGSHVSGLAPHMGVQYFVCGTGLAQPGFATGDLPKMSANRVCARRFLQGRTRPLKCRSKRLQTRKTTMKGQTAPRNNSRELVL